MPLLEVSNLRIRLQTHRGPADAVRGVSFSLARGETLGLIGESGCGKSITAMSLMGLLPESAQVTGSIRFDGQELVGRTDAQMCKLLYDLVRETKFAANVSARFYKESHPGADERIRKLHQMIFEEGGTTNE